MRRVIESELFAQARAAEQAYVDAVRDGQIALPEDRPRSRRREAARVQAQRDARANGQVADDTDDEPQTRPKGQNDLFRRKSTSRWWWKQMGPDRLRVLR